ncbi:MAG: glycosyltransferase family 10, partial [Bacteroidota bacterium]
MTRNTELARKASLLFPFKTIMVWSNEPRYDRSEHAIMRGKLGQRIHIFNVFTGDVFWHNLHFLSSYHFIHTNDLGMLRGRQLSADAVVAAKPFGERKMAIGIFGYREQTAYPIAGKDRDLNQLRQDIARTGRQRGCCDVMGQGWPADIALEATGYENEDTNNAPWWVRKLEVIQHYCFNIALENTIWPYYVTEKIWHAIQAGCVPVYYGAESTIYETFPEGSFVDASHFSTPEDLWDFLEQMTEEEWTRRLRVCTDVYNREMQ